MTLSARANRIMAFNPTELMRIDGYVMYEHPLRGDEAPIYMLTPDGNLINTGEYDLDDFDLAYCREIELNNNRGNN